MTRHNNYLPEDLLNIFRAHYSQNTPGRLLLTIGKLMIKIRGAFRTLSDI